MFRLTATVVAVLMVATTPLARAENQPVPVLWEGRIADADGNPTAADVVAFARPAGADLPASGNALVPVARTSTDSSGRYVLRAGRLPALQATEDEAGWANVMVAAFGEDGAVSLAIDSVAWQPAGRGKGYHADRDSGRWVTSPAERVALARGAYRAAGAVDTSRERPAVMVLAGGGGAKRTTMAVPPPMREVGMCTGPHKTEDLGVNYTPVGELHLEQAWNGAFKYTTAKTTSFQVGFRHEGGRWSAGGSVSSVKGRSNGSGDETVPGGRMYTFAADMVYKRFTWKCNRAETWRWVETVEPVVWGGGVRRIDTGGAPGCDPRFRSPVSPTGYSDRHDGGSITLNGAISVAGFSGSMTSTIENGVYYRWNNELERERYLCGTSGRLTDDTRVVSLR